MKLFLSYSSKDAPVAQKIVTALRRNGVDIWFDQAEIKVGQSIVDRISDALDQIEGYVILLSRNSMRSKWVQQELTCVLTKTLSTHPIRIYPVLLDNCVIPPLLLGYRYADCRRSVKEGLSQLLCGISPIQAPHLPGTKRVGPQATVRRFKQLHDACWLASMELQRDLLILGESIMKAWCASVADGNGRINVYRPSFPGIREEVADAIIDLLDGELPPHSRCVSPIHALPIALRWDAAKRYYHFDRDLFVRRKQPFTFSGGIDHGIPMTNTLATAGNSDIYSMVFDSIIPSQCMNALVRFATRWGQDVTYDDVIPFKEYFAKSYDVKLSAKRWNRETDDWKSSPGDFKRIVFLERAGFGCPGLITTGWSAMLEKKPVLRAAVQLAFSSSSWREPPSDPDQLN